MFKWILFYIFHISIKQLFNDGLLKIMQARKMALCIFLIFYVNIIDKI